VSTSEDGTFAMKKVLIQSKEQLDLVREEIRVSSLFNHPNLLPLLDHAIIAVKVIHSAFYFSLYVPRDAEISNYVQGSGKHVEFD
jgi:serine/threonine kinase 16